MTTSPCFYYWQQTPNWTGATTIPIYENQQQTQYQPQPQPQPQYQPQPQFQPQPQPQYQPQPQFVYFSQQVVPPPTETNYISKVSTIPPTESYCPVQSLQPVYTTPSIPSSYFEETTISNDYEEESSSDYTDNRKCPCCILF